MVNYETPEQYKRQAAKRYDKYNRDKEAKRFYNSKAWRTVREMVLTRDNYLCQQCLKEKNITPAYTVHHIKELKECPELALDEKNLETICHAHHNKEHPEKGKTKEIEPISKKIKVVKG